MRFARSLKGLASLGLTSRGLQAFRDYVLRLHRVRGVHVAHLGDA